MMMAQSLFMALKQTDPACIIDVLAPVWSLPLLTLMPEVNKGVVNPFGHGEFNFFGRLKFGRQLRKENYDQAIVLPGSWKSALIPFFAGIPKRTGYFGECRIGFLNDIRKLDKTKLVMTVQRFVALGLDPNAILPPAYSSPHLLTLEENRQAVLKKFGLKASQKILVLCPGAEFGSSKRWPPAHFAAIADAKLKENWQVWLLGSEKDKPAAAFINQAADGQCRDFIGATSLSEAVHLLTFADAVVTNDSGLMHIAAALNKKIVALYGSTPSEFTPPLCEDAHIVSLNLSCSPCRKRICPLYPPDHLEHNKCLTGIRPEKVLELIQG